MVQKQKMVTKSTENLQKMYFWYVFKYKTWNLKETFLGNGLFIPTGRGPQGLFFNTNSIGAVLIQIKLIFEGEFDQKTCWFSK